MATVEPMTAHAQSHLTGTMALAIYGAVVATGSVLWQVYLHFVVRSESRRKDASGVVGRLAIIALVPESGDRTRRRHPTRACGGSDCRIRRRWEPIRADLEALRVAQPAIASEVRSAIDTAQESMNYSFSAMREEDRPAHANIWDDLRTRYTAATTAVQRLEAAVQRH